ncbi:60S ribosomal protein L36a [Platanthera zijinensis]|uniref:60S ribosomal protein L36a n=1 Tax=Platanthera zijinensis TaxID=2320716 RepID=A0AAP0BUC7_9ASPA
MFLSENLSKSTGVEICKIKNRSGWEIGSFREERESMELKNSIDTCERPEDQEDLLQDKVCKKHTWHKVTHTRRARTVSPPKESSRKQSGYGRQTKPIFHKKAKNLYQSPRRAYHSVTWGASWNPLSKFNQDRSPIHSTPLHGMHLSHLLLQSDLPSRMIDR